MRHALFLSSRMPSLSRELKLLRQKEVIQILIGQQMAPTALGPEDNKLYNCLFYKRLFSLLSVFSQDLSFFFTMITILSK